MMRRDSSSRPAAAGRHGHLRIPRPIVVLASVLFVAGSVLPVLPIRVPISQAQASPGIVNIVVRDAKTTDPIPRFRWVVNLDNSHDQGSLENPASFSPVVASGDETNATDVSLPDTVAPNRGYLVTVYANDGVGSPTTNDPDYKIGGKHFTLPADAGDVVVELQPHPQPLATIKARVFSDDTSPNTEFDVGLEGPPDGVENFHVIIDDKVGEVTTDWFGNPICTEYSDFPGGTPVPGTGGFCRPGPDGIATIPNLGPNKYEVQVIPPDGQGWVQTTTIEGGFSIAAWVPEGSAGFASEPEEAMIGSQTWFGFIKRCMFGDTSAGDFCDDNNDDATGTGTIKGCMYTNKLDTTETIFALGPPISDLWVTLTDAGNNDALVWSGPGDPDGCFDVGNVPASTYLIALFDQSLDHIIKFTTVILEEGGTVDMGGKIGSGGGRGVAPWFGKMFGSVYLDTNENGLRDAGETPIKAVDLDTRFKDGSIMYTAFTDNGGKYEFPEVFEWEHFFISEVGYGRFRQTGAAVYRTDLENNPIDYPWANDCNTLDENGNGYGDDSIPGCVPDDPSTPGVENPDRFCAVADDWTTCEHGPINQTLGLASLLQATFLSSGQSFYFDWGKKPFGPGENGGIVGIVFNGTTRNELNAQLQANEDYEPGVPNVPVNLYATRDTSPADGMPDVDTTTGAYVKDHLAAVYKDGLGTDSWYDDLLPKDCIPISTFGRSLTQVQPYPDIWDKCLELESILNQDKDGVFDGGYAFDVDCTNPAAVDPFNPAELLPIDDCTPVAAGTWIVEIEPSKGYRSVMEEDINVFSGDVLVPAIPPPPCAGPMHTVHVVDDRAEALFDPDDPSNVAKTGVYNPDFLATTSVLAPDGGSPFEGDRMPLCNARLIDLKTGNNANSDFFIFTDARYKGGPPVTPSGGGIPVPGRIVGILLDDLGLDLDPNSANYAGKRGLPNTPVGIRDYSGKLITTLYTDAYGRFEVLLPSTGTYNCPLPAGPCAGMYYVVGNDPGDVAAPSANFNPNYQTLPLVFEVWPGLTTYADVAIIPTTNLLLTSTGGSQFSTPPVCKIDADTTPDIQSVSQPYGMVGDSFTIRGVGFGGTQGTSSATLDGEALTVTSWSDSAIGVTIPATVPAGPHQLLVTRGGSMSPSGMTIHVLGAGYDFTALQMRHVGVGQEYTDLQLALDEAVDGDLILVHPGTYFDRFILHTNVKMQGYGTAGPFATLLDGRFLAGASGLDQLGFDVKVDAIPHGGGRVPWGQVVTVLAADGQFHSGYRPQIDGFKIAYGRTEHGNGLLGPGQTSDDTTQGGGVYVHRFARNLEISNNLITGNFGRRGGGVILGLPSDFGGNLDAQNDDVRIHHNQVLNNGGKNHAGAVALFNGAQDYEVDHNVICGNYAAEYGAGISNFGLNDGGRIHDNKVLFNYAFDEGGGIMIAGEMKSEAPGVPGTGLSLGSGDIVVERNLVQGNVSNDDGGGIRVMNTVQWNVRIANNMIVNNLATDIGGGISLDDVLDVEIVNNTVARNVSTATAEDADISCNAAESFATCPHGAGLTSTAHSEAVREFQNTGACTASGADCTSEFSNPVLFNNIFRANEAFYSNGATDLFGNGLLSAGTIDFEVIDVPGAHFDTRYSDCTFLNDDCLASKNNTADAPGFVQSVDTDFVATAFANDPAFIYVNVISTPSDPQGDYHLQALAQDAIDGGVATFGGVAAPACDFDLDGRPNGAGFDIGADEQPGVTTPCPDDAGPPPPAAAQLYFSTAGGLAVPDVTGPYDDADIYSWDGASFALVFDGSAAGLAGGADIDALVVVDSDTYYMSFTANGGTSVPTLGAVQDEDVVMYDAGTWSLYFDGSDAGVDLDDSNGEDVDAFEILPDGNVVISTTGDPNVPGITGELQEDLLKCTGTFGSTTTCTWSYYFDAGDVGFTTGGEDVDAAALDGTDLYLSTQGGFAVAGPLTGGGEDVFRCNGLTPGTATSCTGFAMFFDGSANGITDTLDAIDRP